jgi:DNA-directed RNA polymerase specialized sigma24 family protein
MNYKEHSGGSAAFFTTRWTMVLRARGDAPEAKAALGELCEAYWMPVFNFLRREGRGEDQSREIAQEFICRLLSRPGIDKADPEKGRFRSYLLGALKNFLAETKRNEGRLKRGGDAVIESIDSGGTETSPGWQIPDPSAEVPDSYFDRQWALAIMDRSLKTVQATFGKAGKEAHFEVLKAWLIGETGNLSQTEAAASLGMTTGALKVAIHRLRASFRETVQAEISQTVEDADEAAEELRYLIEVLSTTSPGK